MFYPLSALPAWAAAIAAWLPTTAIFENVRAAIFGTPFDYALLFRAFWMNIIILFVVSLFLKSSFQRARKTGLLARGD